MAGSWPLPSLSALADLAGVLAAIPDDAVVLLDGLVACGAPDIVCPESARLRLVVLVHLPLADEAGQPAATMARLHTGEGQTLHAATAIVATSRWAARRLVDRHRLRATRVHTATPGVDIAPLASGTASGSRLLCVAAVTPRKGQDVLAEALSRIADRSWSCVCVGALDRCPGYVDRVRRSARAHGLAGRIRLVGPRTGTELAAAYAAADLMVLASRAETYGMVVTEALARGMPVVATDVGGVPEALGRAPDGMPPGILIPPADPASLATALRRWLDEPGWRRRLRGAALARRATLPGWPDTIQRLGTVLAGLDGLGEAAGRAR